MTRSKKLAEKSTFQKVYFHQNEKVILKKQRLQMYLLSNCENNGSFALETLANFASVMGFNKKTLSHSPFDPQESHIEAEIYTFSDTQ